MQLRISKIVMFCAGLLVVSAVEARPFDGSASGWGLPAAEIGTGGGGSTSTASGQSSLGVFSVSGAGAVDFTDFLGFCDVDGSDDPAEQNDWLFPYTALAQVMRFENGDLLFQELSAEASTFCLSSAAPNDRLRFEVHTDVVGGTGRFEGASGSVVSRGTGRNLSTMGGFSSTFSGELILP